MAVTNKGRECIRGLSSFALKKEERLMMFSTLHNTVSTAVKQREAGIYFHLVY